MRKLRELSMAVVLTFALATFAFAGIISSPPEAPPPAPDGGIIDSPPSSLAVSVAVALIQIAVR